MTGLSDESPAFGSPFAHGATEEGASVSRVDQTIETGSGPDFAGPRFPEDPYVFEPGLAYTLVLPLPPSGDSRVKYVCEPR